jgi:hypothetical protein
MNCVFLPCRSKVFSSKFVAVTKFGPIRLQAQLTIVSEASYKWDFAKSFVREGRFLCTDFPHAKSY